MNRIILGLEVYEPIVFVDVCHDGRLSGSGFFVLYHQG